MKPALQFRVWWRQAPVAHRAVTAVVGLVVVSLLALSFHGPADPSRTLASEPVAGSTDTGATVTNPDGTTTVTNPDGTTEIVNPDGTTEIVNPDGTTTVVPGSGTPAAGASSAPGATGSGSKPAATKAAAGGSTAPAGTVDVSKATDRGVNSCSFTGPCVKLGFVIGNIGGLAASGFALNERTDLQDVTKAFVAYQNAHGGIGGRKIEGIYRVTDPVEQDDQNKACTQFTQDDKVFGVVDTSAFIFAAAMACLTQDNLTPYIHSFAEDDAFQAVTPGYEITPVRTLDRIAKEWVTESKSTGFIKGGEKVGILEDNCEPSHSVVKNILIPGLKNLGATGLKTYESDCTAASAQSQPPGYAATMCTDGVTNVFLATSFVAAQTFLQAADATPCGTGPTRFKYFASDYSLLVSDLFDAKFNANQFDGALGITNSYTGQAAAGKPAPAKLAFCNKALAEGNSALPLMDMTAANTDAREMCDNFFLMVDVAAKVGGNLTRAAWAKASASYGEFDGVTTQKSLFKPGRYSGGDTVQTVMWHRSCSCWQTTQDFHATSG